MANKRVQAVKKKAFASNLSTSNLIALSILVGILSIVVAIIIGRFLVDNMMLNARVIGKKSTANKQINANYDALKGLQSEYNSLGATRDTVATALPTRPNLPELWAMLENIGNTSGVSITSVSATATTDAEAPAGGPVQPLQVNVTVQGSYNAVQNFLKNAEKSTRPLRVTNITLSGTNASAQANIQMTTYYQGAADLNIGSEVVQ